jgi:m7GpppX diphosphatase
MLKLSLIHLILDWYPKCSCDCVTTDNKTDQPTYYHFHVHIVHVRLEQGMTQATGKALGLEHIISQLETMTGDDDAGMADVSLTYTLGEASELWTEIFLPLKRGSKS